MNKKIKKGEKVMVKRRSIAAVIAIVLCTSLLAACSSSTTGGSNGKLELTVWNTQGVSVLTEILY